MLLLVNKFYHKEWTGVACDISKIVKSPEPFCSWQISSVDNVTLLCKVDLGPMINKLSYNLTNNSLNVSRNLTIVADSSTTECVER